MWPVECPSVSGRKGTAQRAEGRLALRQGRDEDVKSARCEIARVDTEIARVVERIAAHEFLLSVAERDDARVEANGLLDQMRTAYAALCEAWARFMAQRDEADEAARAVVTAR